MGDTRARTTAKDGDKDERGVGGEAVGRYTACVRARETASVYDSIRARWKESVMRINERKRDGKRETCYKRAWLNGDGEEEERENCVRTRFIDEAVGKRKRKKSLL